MTVCHTKAALALARLASGARLCQQGVTPPKSPSRDTHPSGLWPCQGVPGKIEGLAVLKSKSLVQVPAKHLGSPAKLSQDPVAFCAGIHLLQALGPTLGGDGLRAFQPAK